MYTIPKLSNTLYLRFKDLPDGERSGIYSSNGEEKIGEELGVSCYKGVVIDDMVYIIMPHKQSTTYYWLLEEYNRGKIPLYIISGDEVGKGTDDEPVLKNVKIERKIKDWKY
jgi:hypothetical protein